MMADDLESRAGLGPQNGPSPQKHISDFGDPINKIWSVYVREAERFDKALVEDWRGTMDSILIFAGLFSGVVTTFIIGSLKGLSEDPAEVSIALLRQIALQSATAPGSIPSPTSSDQVSAQTAFIPTKNALCVNALLFLSLSFSLTSALVATLVQQWARNYAQAIEHRPSPHRRGKVRAYLFEGVERFRMSTVVKAIPMLLHISLLLFSLGLTLFLIPQNVVIGYLVSGLIILGTVLYCLTSIIPLVLYDYPYHTPLSTVLWHALQHMKRLHQPIMGKDRPKAHQFSISRSERRELVALDHQSSGSCEREFHALSWTLDLSSEDYELEDFMEGLPAYHESTHGGSITERLSSDRQLGARIMKLLDTTHKQSGEARAKRAIICLEALCSLLRNGNIRRAIGPTTLSGIWGLRLCKLVKDDNLYISNLALCAIYIANETSKGYIPTLFVDDVLKGLKRGRAYSLSASATVGVTDSAAAIRPFNLVVQFVTALFRSSKLTYSVLKYIITKEPTQMAFVECIGIILQRLQQDRLEHPASRTTDLLMATTALDDPDAIAKAIRIIEGLLKQFPKSKAAQILELLKSKSGRDSCTVAVQGDEPDALNHRELASTGSGTTRMMSTLTDDSRDFAYSFSSTTPERRVDEQADEAITDGPGTEIGSARTISKHWELGEENASTHREILSATPDQNPNSGSRPGLLRLPSNVSWASRLGVRIPRYKRPSSKGNGNTSTS